MCRKLNLLIVLFSVFQFSICLDCPLQPILSGVSVKQSFGESNKKVYTNEPDCKQRCADETDFVCNAILWPGTGLGDCYLYDKIDLNREIFVDQRKYILYVPVCDGEPTPAVGYCQYVLTQANVEKTTSVSFVTPGSASEDSCREFCLANYRGIDCNAFIVSSTFASPCTLYETIPTDLQSGDQNLWTKTCSPPPENCQYSAWTEWTTCSVSCGGGSRSRTRKIEKEGSSDGVQCLESETSATDNCGVQDCDADCIYSEWTAFGDCNATCATSGFRTRTRTVLKEATSGGAACQASGLTDSKECASTSECGNSCIYSAWTSWSTCSEMCQQTRSRTLEMGDPTNCEIEHGPLENVMTCEGGLCGGTATTASTLPHGGAQPTTTTQFPGIPGSGTTTTIGGQQPIVSGSSQPTTNSGSNVGSQTTTTAAPLPETGCRVLNIDPSAPVSSKGYKAVGARSDCASMCRQETSFTCEAYITTGPGGPCILHGTIDYTVTTLTKSRYYLQDLMCKTNVTSASKVCHWELTKGGVNLSFDAPGNHDSIGLTIDAPHCATLCLMNHPIFKPKPCQSYAWNPNTPYTYGIPNCFMYNWDAKANLTTGGDYDVYTLICPE